jgi:hypothetical protein
MGKMGWEALAGSAEKGSAGVVSGDVGVYQEQSELELIGILHQTGWRNRGA